LEDKGERLSNSEVGPVVVRYGRTMPRLKMRKGEIKAGERKKAKGKR